MAGHGFCHTNHSETHMRINLYVIVAAILSIGFIACDDTTDDIGQSIISHGEKLDITTDTFTVLGSRTIVADSVLANSVTGYLGRVKDPETGALTTADFMSQFRIQDNYRFPAIDSVMSKDANGAIADSCFLQLNFFGYFGDSLSQMKLTAYEMDHPLEENVSYYSNYDLEKRGYIRKDGLSQSRSYTLANMSFSDDQRSSSSYQNNLIIRLNKPYTDKNGNHYNNYGTYIMRMYYQHPEYFRNSYTFTKYVCPGFYLKTTGGEGALAYVNLSNLYVYFKYKENDTLTVTGQAMMAGTEEVLQSTHIINDQNKMSQLASDTKCTYVKSPAGLFTEITLPVNEIIQGHEKDSLSSVKLVVNRIVNSEHSRYSLPVPTYMLLIPKSEMYSFFENGDLPDNKTSYLASYGGASSNNYTYNNIEGVVRYMYDNHKDGDADWNKVVLIPVTPSYTTRTSYGQTTQVLTKLVHDMTMGSTKLIGGSDNPNEPMKVTVVYSKFNN